MQYRALEAISISELNNDVNFYIKNGWKPIGGVSVATIHAASTHYRYTQAIVKDD